MNKNGLTAVLTFLIVIFWSFSSMTLLLYGILNNSNCAGAAGAVIGFGPILYAVYKQGSK